MKNPAVLSFIAALLIIVMGVALYQNGVGFWEFIEGELMMLLYLSVLISAILVAELDEFAYGSGGEKFAAILFVPLCAAATALGARYGGDLIFRGLDALITGEAVDLSRSFSMGNSVLGEYPVCLWVIGLAFTPISWMATANFAIRYRWWLFCALGAALIGALSVLLWIAAAMIVVYVLAVAIVVIVIISIIVAWFRDD